MFGLGGFLASTAAGQVIRRFVDRILSELGLVSTDESDREERRELIHALARAQREQAQQRQQAEDERSDVEDLEAQLEQQRRVLDLMDRQGYGREMLVQRYEEDSELYVLLVAAADKNPEDENEDENSYLKDILDEKYGAESIAGALKIIPPHRIPDSITSDEDVEDWAQELVNEQPDDSPPSGIYLATRKKLESIFSAIETEDFDNGWKTAEDVVDKVLHADDLQGLINSAPVSPVALVQDGDLLFLAQGSLPDSEVNNIKKYQQEISRDLTDPDLYELVEEVSTEELVDVLENRTDHPEKTASALLAEAKRIHNELSNSEALTTF